MKKFLGILLIIAVVVPCCFALLTACDSDSGKPTDYTHTIVFYSSQGDALQQQTQVAINNFEAKYPGWKVQHVTVGGYDDVKEKIIADFQGKQQPDLAYCYADHVAQYLQTKKVVDMSDLINSTETVDDVDGNPVTVGYSAEEVADFVKGYYDEGYAHNYGDYAIYGYEADDMLTLPFVKSTELMYYNKDALDAVGLKPATTWDELWAQCATLKSKYPTATPLGYDSEANWFITMCEQNGWGYTSANNPHYLFNNENTKAWLTQLNEYYDKGYIATQKEYNAYTSALFTKGATDGGAIYCIGSSGGASHQNPGSAFQYGIAPIPGSKQADGSINNSAISQGPSLVMFEAGNGVDNIDEKKVMTFLFVKELLDPTFQAAFAIASGYNPARNSVYEIETYVEHMNGTDITAVASKVAASMSDRFFTSPAFIGSSNARTQVGNVLVYSILGSKSPEKALSDAVANCGGNK